MQVAMKGGVPQWVRNTPFIECTGMRGSGSSKDFFCRARIGIVFPFVWDSGEGGGPAVGGFDFSAGILENAVKYSRTTDEVSVFSGVAGIPPGHGVFPFFRKAVSLTGGLM